MDALVQGLSAADSAFVIECLTNKADVTEFLQKRKLDLADEEERESRKRISKQYADEEAATISMVGTGVQALEQFNPGFLCAGSQTDEAWGELEAIIHRICTGQLDLIGRLLHLHILDKIHVLLSLDADQPEDISSNYKWNGQWMVFAVLVKADQQDQWTNHPHAQCQVDERPFTVSNDVIPISLLHFEGLSLAKLPVLSFEPNGAHLVFDGYADTDDADIDVVKVVRDGCRSPPGSPP